MSASLLLIGVTLAAALGLAGCASWTAERRVPPLGSFLEVDGERLHLIDTGPADLDLPPVVLIHGASVNLLDMHMALGGRLAENRRVIVIDRPGRGYSSRPADGAKLTAQARLIRAAVVSLGVEQPIIVGHSLGAAVALRYAIDFDDEVAGLGFLSGVSHEWPGGVAWYNNVSGWPIVGFAFRRLVLPLYAPIAARRAVEKSFRPDDAPANYFDEAGLELLFRAGDFRANAADLRALKDEVRAMRPHYADLQVPTVIMTGLADPTVSPRLHSFPLAQELPNAKLITFPGRGHALHHAEAEAIVEAINALSAQAQKAAELQNDLRSNVAQ